VVLQPFIHTYVVFKMFSAIKTLAITTALAHFHGTSAAPAPAAPEVIPGPGLPSLESLGLTSSYLYNVLISIDTTHLLARADPRCGDEYNYGPVDGAVACFHYLQGLGQTGCGVPSGQRSVIMCSSNGIRITGYGIGQASWW
jgi:hypothetical protein